MVGYEDGAAVAIAPLVLDRYPRKVFRMLGHGSSIGNTDFIYREEKYGRVLFAYIKENVLEGSPLELWRVDESSFLVKEMNLNYIRPAMKVEVRNFERYFSKLSSKERNNIRRAYKYLLLDSVDWEVRTYYSGDPEIRSIIHNLVSMYYTRMKKWKDNDNEYSFLRRFYLASRDITFASLYKIPSVRLHVMYVNGDIAYFIIGYECDDIIYVPHSAMNERFARYRPGIVTIIEWLKEYSHKGPFVLDIGAGDEAYKKDLGCEGYSLYMLTTE